MTHLIVIEPFPEEARITQMAHAEVKEENSHLKIIGLGVAASANSSRLYTFDT